MPSDIGISVVIPVFGRPDALRIAIDSVATATPASAEIIVIDDGSPEPLGALVPSLNRHGVVVRYYRLPQNRGPQAARNLGIRRARFDHVAFLDSDDAFLPTKIDRVRAHLVEEHSDLVFHGVEGMPLYTRIGRMWDRHLRTLVPFGWLIAVINPVPTPALVIRRNGRLGLPRMRHAEDWAFLLRAVRGDMKIGFIDQPLSRVHRPLGSAGGQSGARWRMRRGEFQARAMLLKERGLSGWLKYGLGTIVGSVRVAWDVVRLRYWVGGGRG